MTTVEVRESPEDLARRIKYEHTQVLAAFDDALSHAVAAGEALLAARQSVAPEQWVRWVAEATGLSKSTTQVYARLALYKHLLPQGVSITDANRVYLRGLPAIANPNEQRATPEATQAEIARLHAEGVPVTDIAPMLSVSIDTVRRTVDPEARRRWIESKRRSRARRRAARDALAAKAREEEEAKRQQELAELVRVSKGATAEAYALLRRAVAQIDKALKSSDDDELRRTLSEALLFAYRSEDAVVSALKREREHA